MSQTVQIQPLEEEERKKIEEEAIQKLQFAINPKIYELRVLPYSFVEIPSISRFGTARYKFKKYLGKGFVLFHDDESIIKYNAKSIELYYLTRTSKKVYHYTWHEWEWEDLPKELTPRLSDLIDDNSEYISEEGEKEIVKRFFALRLGFAEVLKQGHLYALAISCYNIEKWFTSDSTAIVSGYKLSANAFKITDEIYYLKTDCDVKVTHPEHGETVLQRGEWLLYHPSG